MGSNVILSVVCSADCTIPVAAGRAAEATCQPVTGMTTLYLEYTLLLGIQSLSTNLLDKSVASLPILARKPRSPQIVISFWP
jgi:hypothetical protein